LIGFTWLSELQNQVSTLKMLLRVAIVGPPLSVLFGGQEVQAAALVSQWQNDPEVSAAFVASRPAFPRALALLDRVPYLRTLARLPLYIFRLFRDVGKVELVHIFAGSFGTFLAATGPAFVVARLRGKRIILHYHSGRGDEHLGRSVLARHILRACDGVVVPSEYLAASFRKHGISSLVVPNLVDPGMYPYCLRDPLQPRLLCTRNLEAHYGVDIVVRAFAMVQQEFPEASLCVVGSGQQERIVAELVRKLALNHVQIVGAVHPQDMPAVYCQADIFVNGSYIDCSPVSILEAFCSGLPVVTTAAGGIPHLVDHGRTGFICPSGNWVALAESVIQLLRHQDLAGSISENARQQAELHSWNVLRMLWLAVYRAAIERPRPSARRTAPK
jgi:glycosyltransferase involved in cell wall biosynthesis